MATTLEQIQERLRRLPPEKLAVVLDFVSYLADRQSVPPPGEAPPRVDWDAYREDPEDQELAEEGLADYAASLEDYEQRLARGEIKWE